VSAQLSLLDPEDEWFLDEDDGYQPEDIYADDKTERDEEIEWDLNPQTGAYDIRRI
jgi:hypothetical protein